MAKPAKRTTRAAAIAAEIALGAAVVVAIIAVIGGVV